MLKEKDLPDLEDDDEFYHHDLLGLEARTEDGQVLGNIEEITPGTVAIFTISDGETEHFIPFISERVLEIKENVVSDGPYGTFCIFSSTLLFLYL